MSLARQVRASAVLLGTGGDWLFYRSGLLPEATDYAYRHGLFGGLLQSVFDSASLGRCSIWEVLRPAIKYGLLKHPTSVLDRGWLPNRGGNLLTPGLAQDTRADPLHPLFRNTSDIAPGKLFHAYLITAGTARRYTPFESEGDLPTEFPLCSQPFMELSLRIPVDVLTTRGRDRSIARDAFQHDLPRSIIRRKSKGGAAEHLKTLFVSQIDLIRDLLLDGVLVQRGYLDRPRLLALLGREPHQIQAWIFEVMQYVTVEAWCRSVMHGTANATVETRRERSRSGR